MDKLPPALVQVWLTMAHTEQTHFQDTKDKAIKKLIHHFGNVDIAQMYVDEFKKRNDEVVKRN
ncbi:hypothetical protein [Thalassomonas haliotis]|uniref:Uncharacterized protein n=1 Tax=Thalassomonas haliotis TaxID=485448 RepID=A0ABY7V8X5_9GAMM|nr:hypothetical protein [Thalassomonas haliotis]WDE09489.1 hypothetical protein H3N35_14195 [Thalassomonas haliotis]